MKKTISIILIILLTVIALCGHVNAGIVRIETSNSDVTNGQTVSVTVSFGEKVSAAQFTLSYDTSKFEYISCSDGKFGTKTNTFVYLNLEDERDLESVVLTFKSKNVGTGTFSVSDVILSTENVSMSNESVSITIKEAENNGSGNNSGNNGSTNNSGNNSSGTNSGNNGSSSNSGSNSSGTNSGNSASSNNSGNHGSSNNSGTTSLVIKSNNSNKNNISTSNMEFTLPIEEEYVEKPELEAIKTALIGKLETDYTEESWKELQEAITLAETANTNAKYNEIKGLLTTDNLVKATFEKTELNQILIDLIGKSSKDYTEESWNKLLETIKLASNAELKSEYEAIKDKLTINNLVVIEEQKDAEEISKNSFENTTLIISLAVIALIVLIIIIIVFKKLRSK